MKSLLLDLLVGFWNHRPATAFVSSSLGLNLAVAIYRPLLRNIVEVLLEKYVSPTVVGLQGTNLSAIDRQRLDFFAGRLYSGMERMGERSIREAQGYALVLAVVCFLVLYFDFSRGPVLFLPTVPVWFAIAVYYYSRKRCKKYRQDVATILAFLAPTKGAVEEEIKGSLKTRNPFDSDYKKGNS